MSCCPPIEFEPCPVVVEECDLVTEQLPWLIASALLCAADEIAKSTECGKNDHFSECYVDGVPGWWPKGGPVEDRIDWGTPRVGAECCGQICAGIVWPDVAQEGCVKITELRFPIKVSWCEMPPCEQIAEALRMDRLLVKHACKKLLPSVAVYDLKNIDLAVESYEQESDEACDRVVFIVKATL